MLELMGGWTRLRGDGVMIVVLVWVTRSHSLYDFFFLGIGLALWAWMGWEVFIICMGWDWHGCFPSNVDMMC